MTGDKVNVEAIPQELKRRGRWVLWRDDPKNGKAPLRPSGRNASSTDPQTWCDFEAAVEALPDFAGLGIVLGDGITGIDLDDCRDPTTGAVDEGAWEIVKELDSYTEVSPSGEGLHILCFGGVPNARNTDRTPWGGKLEVYPHSQHFTVTGDRLDGLPAEPQERTYELKAFYEHWFGDDDRAPAPGAAAVTFDPDAPFPQEKHEALLANSADYAASWEHRKQLKDTSLSGYDQSLCDYAAQAGWSDAELCALIREHRLRFEPDDTKWRRRDYVAERTIAKARRQAGAAEPEHDDDPAPPDDEEADYAEAERAGRDADSPAPELLFGPYQDFALIREAVRATTWLWPSWVPEGVVSIVGGDQESGKSFFGLRLAPSVTTGSPWPDDAPGPRPTGPVLWIEAEASHATTAERADKMGIPLAQLKHMPSALDGWCFDDPEHLQLIRQYAAQEAVRLVVIDSLSTAFSGDENSSEIRHSLAKVEAMARDLHIAVVMVHHLRKAGPLDTKEFDPDRLRGSSAVKQVARAIIGIDRPDRTTETRRLQLVKCNFLATKPAPLGYALEHDCQVCFSDQPPIATDRKSGPFEKAVVFLAATLTDGAKEANEVLAEAKEVGIAERTLYRAKKELGVGSFKPLGQSCFFWGLSKDLAV